MAYPYVIFDLDGTLLNTLDDLADAGNHVCKQRGWPTHPVSAYRYFVGNGIPKLVERLSPATARDGETQKQALADFLAWYELHKADKTAPYPGIPELLAELKQKGIVFGVVTNKDDAAAKALLPLYFGDSVAFVQGRVDSLPPKPDAGTTLALMHTMGAVPARTLFVGDSNVDAATAANANLPCCGVLWGFREKAELKEAGAAYFAQTPADLRALILE